MSNYRLPMMFPGQASQFVGMTRELYESAGPAREYLKDANDALGYDLLSIMHNGPAELLTETHNAQPAILAHSVAMFLSIQEREIDPLVVAGHSLGEFSAAVACGALCPFDALRTVRKRGELMFAAGQKRPGTMAAVLGLDAGIVADICQQTDGVVVLANHNSPVQVVISGEIAAVQAASDALSSAGARRVIPLNVSGAFHSPLLEDAAHEFQRYLTDIKIEKPFVPLVANVSAEPVDTAPQLRKGFEQQLTSPVLWYPSLKHLTGAAKDHGVVLEVGPGKVLTNLAKRLYPDFLFINVGTLAELDLAVSKIKDHGA